MPGGGVRGRRRGAAAGLLAASLALPGADAAADPSAAYPRPGSTRLVSFTSTGGLPNDGVADPVLARGGRVVAFSSSATNLVAEDTNGTDDIFVRDLDLGTTERVSLASDGRDADAISASPTISRDGDVVAFTSLASNLVPDDTNATFDIFVFDRVAGEIDRVSVGRDGGQSNGTSSRPRLSADGRFVAFTSAASNLVSGDANGFSDVFVHDRLTGITERVSVSTQGTEGNLPATASDLSDDGRYVVFQSLATNLDAAVDVNLVTAVFRHDRLTGETTRMSVADDGSPANGNAYCPVTSGDGTVVAFTSSASNLVPADSNGSFAVHDVFVRDLATARTARVSVTSEGAEVFPDATNDFACTPDLSADGRYVAFRTLLPLSERDGFVFDDVYVHDRVTGSSELVSVSSAGVQGQGSSLGPSLSPDGRYVAFASQVPLDPADVNDTNDVFIRDRGPENGLLELSASVVPGGTRAFGRTTSSGAVLGTVSDPSGEAPPGSGLDLTGAAIVYRPEDADVLLRWDVAGVGGVRGINHPATGEALVPGVAGPPGVAYGFELVSEAGRFAVLASRAGGLPTFELFRCDAACTKVGDLKGGLGTAGDGVLVAVPVSAFSGVGAVTDLTFARAFTALGAWAQGAGREVDEVVLPDALVAPAVMHLGVGSPTATEHEVDFSWAVDLDRGHFDVVVPLGLTSDGRIWARLCLADRCDARFVSVPPG